MERTYAWEDRKADFNGVDVDEKVGEGSKTLSIAASFFVGSVPKSVG